MHELVKKWMKRKKDDVFGIIGPVVAITSSFSQLPLSTKNKYKELITKE